MRRKREEIEEVEIVEEPVEEIKEEKSVNLPDFYMIRIGETLQDVANKFNLDIKTLEDLNGSTVIGGNQIRLK